MSCPWGYSLHGLVSRLYLSIVSKVAHVCTQYTFQVSHISLALSIYIDIDSTTRLF